MAVVLAGPIGATLPAVTTWAQQPSAVQPQDNLGRVTGKVEGVPEGVVLAGSRVVLLQFRLNTEGVPEGNPVQTQTLSEDGRYAFDGVPLEARTVYQIGATIDGQVIGSQPFTFPANEREVMLNLRFPQMTGDADGLRIEEALVAAEPRRGSVLVTEVVHVLNPGADAVEGMQRPLELSVPPDAEGLEMIRGVQDTQNHERLGGKLLVYGNLAPGRTTVAFRYRLPVWLGAVTLQKRYPYPVGTLSVLTPEGSLHLDSAAFAPQAVQTIENNRYSAWSMEGLEAGTTAPMALRGVPVRQEVYLLPLIGFFALMAGIVIWFLRRRVGQEDAMEAAEADSA